ncbi:UNVERIFIED_CONTAM: hypothetical protein K2H54_060664 [Gekko kuhli]
MVSLAGTLKLMERADKLLWSVQVDHQLFALEKLDVTGNGHEEVIACAWDGQTYIIDHSRTVARFQVDENVSAFCAVSMPSGEYRASLICCTCGARDTLGQPGGGCDATYSRAAPDRALEPAPPDASLTQHSPLCLLILAACASQAPVLFLTFGLSAVFRVFLDRHAGPLRNRCPSAFIPLGLYACKGSCNSPCLVYVSFNQKILIYWDVQLERMESTNLLKILESNSEYTELLQQLGVGE